MYWVDDQNSKYYNTLVKISQNNTIINHLYYTEVPINKIDWQSAEHLIEYPKLYEYAIEIKYNKEKIKGKGSAIFLHCTNNKPTAGCIAILREDLINILRNIKRGTKIKIN